MTLRGIIHPGGSDVRWPVAPLPLARPSARGRQASLNGSASDCWFGSLRCNGAMVADDADTHTPFQQHREQVLSLEIGHPGVPMALLATVRDRKAAGMRVTISAIDRSGVGTDLREFTIHPFVNKAAVRVEPLSLPLMHNVDSRNGQIPDVDRLELHLTMTRARRQRR